MQLLLYQINEAFKPVFKGEVSCKEVTTSHGRTIKVKQKNKDLIVIEIREPQHIKYRRAKYD